MESGAASALVKEFEEFEAASEKFEHTFENNFDNNDGGYGFRAKSGSVPGETKVNFVLQMIIPDVEVDAVYDLISNLPERLKWDKRWLEGKVVEDKPESSILYWKTPKPPIPLVSSREMLVEIFNLKNGLGDGKHIQVMKSAEHPNHPVKSGMFADVRGTIVIYGTKIEKNPKGSGVLLTESRSFKMNGSIPGVAVSKASTVVPEKTFIGWKSVFDCIREGKPIAMTT
uniref:START domain-containing protein n=1 Tax=Strombidium rassoulzadegani TaxID=1082188 RepID=A0A7S3FXL6_9SPIT|mmetsp:Transcript_17578/g.29677  ORF Transcript_17578/g.29677 Transcript_17578/m.29677 type:complete len:228 (+) Transcript_17578:46-729(+)